MNTSIDMDLLYNSRQITLQCSFFLPHQMYKKQSCVVLISDATMKSCNHVQHAAIRLLFVWKATKTISPDYKNTVVVF